MPIDIKMPALSPTMEEGTLAKWLVEAGDAVKAGDLLAEIETDKATMEFEAVDEGIVAEILVAEGTDGVGVGTVIATLAAEGEEAPAAPAADVATPDLLIESEAPAAAVAGPPPEPAAAPIPVAAAPAVSPSWRDRDTAVDASPLARRIAAQRGIDLTTLKGSGPDGRIVKADVAPPPPPPAAAPVAQAVPPAAEFAPKPAAIPDVPHEAAKLSGMRRTIARRLTESKQQVPHIYLTVDVRLDALLALRAELNGELAPRGVKLSINDMMVKALALALIEVPACNTMFTPDELVTFTRADISVAVSTPTGLLTPVVKNASAKSLSRISAEVEDLAARARDGKLKPEEYAGGTATISNMGMYGISQFQAIINPPQGMILAVGAGERRPYFVNDAIVAASVMSATGSFDHRAVDGADGAQLMRAFKEFVELPLLLAS